ncbi:MAG: MATE family efflux transporter [Gemmatimonadetes bacterium]|nr:MATE family efflux transporter [Gemmatimonadota bacterium]
MGPEAARPLEGCVHAEAEARGSPVTSNRSIDARVVGLALPALGALAADPLVSIVDTAFVGRLGVVPLAALGVNASVFSLAFVVFNFLAYGTTPMVARALARGDRRAAGKLAVEALTLACAAGVVATALLLALAEPVLALMGATGELGAPALSYLRIRALAGPAVLIVTAGHGIFRGWQDTRTPLWITLGLNLVNLVLDPLLIFGLGWGLEGAAIATVVAQWSGAALFLVLILGTRREAMGIELRLPRPRDLRPLLRVGGALLIRTLSLVSTLTLATAVATRLGTAQVAAHQVASQLWLLLALVVDALAVAAQAMVGGAEEDEARRVGNRILLWGLIVGIVLAATFAAARPWLPRLFTSDPDAVSRVDRLLPFIIWMQPLNAVVFVWDGILMGAQRFRILAVQMLLSAAVAAALLLRVVPSGWGLDGVWWAIVALMAVRAITLAGTWWLPAGRSHSRDQRVP